MIETQLVPYDLSMAVIEGLKEKYMDITILPGDQSAYEMVKAGQKECRKIRLDCEEWHKDKKKDILVWGRHYDGEKNRILGLVEPIESRLKDVRKVEDDRIKAIEDARINAIGDKVQEIREMGESLGNMEAQELADWELLLKEMVIEEDEYQELTAEARITRNSSLINIRNALDWRMKKDMEEEEQKVEAAKLEEQRKAQAAEAKRLEAIRLEQEEKAAEQWAKDEEIRTAKEKIVADRKAEQDRKDREKREAEIKLQARIDALREAEEKEEADQREKERQEALKPDKEKLINFADDFLKKGALSILPILNNPKADSILSEAVTQIGKISDWIKQQAEEL